MNQSNRDNSKGYIVDAYSIGHLGDIYCSDKSQQIQRNLLNLNDMRPSLDYWVGRTKEIESIREWLADDKIRLIGIAGLGGCGKSTLAAKIYEHESSEFENKFWVDVSRRGITFTELAQRIFLQLEIPEKDLKDISELDFVDKLVNHLRERKYLLIIDNLESLLNENGQWLDGTYQKFFKAWFDFGGTSKILVTTRERPKLSEIKTKWLPLSGLKTKEGTSLLKSLEIIGNDAQLEELVKKSYGYPLILKFIASFLREEEELNPEISRLQKYNLADVSQFLTDDKLKGDHRGIETAMRQIFDNSFNRLSSKLQKLLLNVSVYRISFNIAAASAQLPDEELTEQELRQIVRRSFLQEERDEDGEKRFKFHPLILEYIKTKSDNFTQAHQIALEYYKSTDKVLILEVFYHHLELKQYEEAFELLDDLRELLKQFALNSLRVELYEKLVQKWQPASKENNPAIAWALTYLGNAYDSLKQYQKAIDCHKDSLKIFKEIKEPNGEASALTHIAQAYNSLGESQEAIEYLRETLETFQKIGHRRHEAVVLSSLGSAYASLKQYQKAIDYYQQSLTIEREIGDRDGEASSLNGLGHVYNSLKEYQKVIDYCQQSLAISHEIGDRNGEAGSLNNLGSAYYFLEEYQKAINNHQQSLAIYREIGDRSGEATSLNNLGSAYASFKQYQKAIDNHRQSLAIYREIGDRSGEATSLNNLGSAYDSFKQYQKAIDYYEKSLTIRSEIGDRSGEATSLNNLGSAYDSFKQYQKAIDYYEKSLTIRSEIGDRSGEATSLNNLAGIYNSLKEYQKVIDYYQQSLAIRIEIRDRDGEASSLNGLGSAYYSLKEYQKAIDYYQQSLTIEREIGDGDGEGGCLCNLGHVYNSLEQYEIAIDRYQQALPILQQTGHRQFEANTLSGLGGAYNSLGEYQTAIDYWEQLLAIYREIDDRDDEAGYLNNLGLAYTSLKQYQKAIDCHEQSLTIKREIGDRTGEANTLLLLAQLYNLIGKPKKAYITAFQAQKILQETQTPIEEWKLIPKWLKSAIKFSESGKVQLIIFFLCGVVAFPFALPCILVLILWRVIRAQFSPR